MRVDCLRIVAEAFYAVGDLDERSEAGQGAALCRDHVAYAVLLEEGVPHVG